MGSVGILELLGGRHNMQVVEGELMPSVWLVADIVPDILADTSKQLYHKSLRDPHQVRASATLDNAQKLYEDLALASRSYALEKKELTNDIRVRLTIAVRALEHAAYHLSKMEERCIKEALL